MDGDVCRRCGEECGFDVRPLDSPELDYYGIDWADFEDAAIEAFHDSLDTKGI